MPGISVSKICVPFGGGGIDWSSYWATRKPSNLIVTGMRDTEIDFSWTDNSAGDCSFKVYKSIDGVNFSADGTTVAGDTTYTATGLTAGTLYYFYVVGVKSSNESDPTDTYDTRFKITVDTTKAGSANDTFILPNYTSGTYNYYVDWGDGGAEEHITTAGNHSHTYAAAGTYQIKIRGTMPRIYFNLTGDRLKVMNIDNWGNLAWSSMVNAFYGCSAMQGRYIDCPNLSAVTNMSYMFRDCSAFNQSVANFNAAKVTNMSYMFNGCTAFNQSVANFNTAKVKNMYRMFYGCTAFNQSVANFNTAEVTDMSYMFYGCTAFNQSVANFNTAKVTNMSYMFTGCTAFKQSLATFSLASATNLTNMLNGCDLNTAGTTTNYDATLVAWAAADVPNSLNFHGGTSKYSAAGGGTAARASLIDDDLWTITDGGEL